MIVHCFNTIHKNTTIIIKKNSYRAPQSRPPHPVPEVNSSFIFLIDFSKSIYIKTVTPRTKPTRGLTNHDDKHNISGRSNDQKDENKAGYKKYCILPYFHQTPVLVITTQARITESFMQACIIHKIIQAAETAENCRKTVDLLNFAWRLSLWIELFQNVHHLGPVITESFMQPCIIPKINMSIDYQTAGRAHGTQHSARLG